MATSLKTFFPVHKKARNENQRKGEEVWL